MRAGFDRDRASTMWKAGYATAAIAEALGTSVGALQSVATADRERFPHRNRPGSGPDGKAAREAAIAAGLKLIAEGLTRPEAASRIGVNPNTFQYWMSKNRDAAAAAELQGAAVRAAAAQAKPAPARPMAAPVGPDARKPRAVPAAATVTASRAPSRPVPSGDAAMDGAGAEPEYVPTRAEVYFALPGVPPMPVHAHTDRFCRWPVHTGGDPLRETTTFFCGAVHGRSEKAHPKYCPTHLAIARGPAAPRRAAGDAGVRS